jgi:hypothetical protein
MFVGAQTKIIFYELFTEHASQRRLLMSVFLRVYLPARRLSGPCWGAAFAAGGEDERVTLLHHD